MLKSLWGVAEGLMSFVTFFLLSSQRYIREDEDGNDYVMYDLDELDLNWLQSVNTKRKFRGTVNHEHVCGCM